MMKKEYMQPLMQVVEIEYNSSLLAGSGETGSTVYDEQAGSGVSGLGRRFDGWDDEDDDY